MEHGFVGETVSASALGGTKEEKVPGVFKMGNVNVYNSCAGL